MCAQGHASNATLDGSASLHPQLSVRLSLWVLRRNISSHAFALGQDLGSMNSSQSSGQRASHS